MTTSSNGKKLLKVSYRWHRKAGVWACIPVIVIALTGVLLNHADYFELNSDLVASSAVLDWYGMEPVSEPLALREGQYLGGYSG